MTQTEFGKHLYAGLSTVQAWEDDTRVMPSLTWEYANLLWAFREVEAAREIWLAKGDIFEVARVGRVSEQALREWLAIPLAVRDWLREHGNGNLATGVTALVRQAQTSAINKTGGK